MIRISHFRARADRRRILEVVGLMCVLCVTLWTYRGAFQGFFIQDDFGWLETTRFRSLSQYAQCFFRFNPALSYRPLSQETFFWAGQQMFGLWPPGFHFMSAFFHLLGAVLVYALLRQFTSALPSLAGTFFFAVHNTHFRSVYWISAVPEPMALVFYLAAILLFVRFDRQSDRRAYGLSIAAMALGMMCKESILSLPLVLASYCALFAPRRLWWTTPHFSLTGLYVVLRWTSDAVEAAPYPLTFSKEAWQNFLAYLSWSAGLSETLLKVKIAWDPERAYVLAGLAFIAVLVFLFGASRNKRLAVFSLAWYFLALQPVLYFSGHIFAYYLAPALPAVSLLLASALPAPRDWKNWIPALGVMAISLGFAYPSVALEGRWWNKRSFVARDILGKIKEVDREVPPGKIAYIFGFGQEEFGVLQYDAAFLCYGYPYPRFVLIGIDRRTEADIRLLKKGGGLNDYYCFVYTGGNFVNATREFRDDPETFIRMLRSGVMDFETIPFLHRPEVRLQVHPGEIQRGKDFLEIRVVNLDAPAIDLLYAIDGTPRLPLHGWKLDKDHTARVFVDHATPKGHYRIRAVRDSRYPSPDYWIRVNAEVRVR